MPNAVLAYGSKFKVISIKLVIKVKGFELNAISPIT